MNSKQNLLIPQQNSNSNNLPKLNYTTNIINNNEENIIYCDKLQNIIKNEFWCNIEEDNKKNKKDNINNNKFISNKKEQYNDLMTKINNIQNNKFKIHRKIVKDININNQRNKMISVGDGKNFKQNGHRFKSNKSKNNKKNNPYSSRKLIPTIHIMKGNNNQLIRQIFLLKGYNQSLNRQSCSLLWLQWFSSNSNCNNKGTLSFYQTQQNSHKTNMINYLQNHKQLTNKQKLYINISKYDSYAVGYYLPMTYIINFKENQNIVGNNILEFLRIYAERDLNKLKKCKTNTYFIVKNSHMEINISLRKLYRQVHNYEPNQPIKINTVKSEANIQQEILKINWNKWILKPTNLNQGRGIHLISSLKQLSGLLSQDSFEISLKVYNELSPTTSSAYVIQQYIQNPLLIEGYKFDIRVWVAVQVVKQNNKRVLKVYLYSEGYGRLASMKYEFGEKAIKRDKNETCEQQHKNNNYNFPNKKKKNTNINNNNNNKFMHLTNNSVQKDAKQYEILYQGNQISFEQIIQYCNKKYENILNNQKLTISELRISISKIIIKTIQSVYQKLNCPHNLGNFQLFGYDFLMTQRYKLYLIECNYNPSFDESSELLKKMLRDMLGNLIEIVTPNRNKLIKTMSDYQDKKYQNDQLNQWLQIM